MKIINNSIRHVSPDISGHSGPEIRGWARKAKAIAEAKKIARKRDRARMRLLATKVLLQDKLQSLAEQKENARLEREKAFANLMQRLEKRGRKHPGRAKSATKSHNHSSGSGGSGEDRLEIRIARQVTGQNIEFAVLASCAVCE